MFYGLADWQFYGHGVYFLILSLMLFFLPGWIFLRKYTKLMRTTRIFLAPVIGIILLTAVSFIGGVVGFYDLVFYYLGAVVIMDVGVTYGYLKKTNIKRELRKIWRGIRSKGMLAILIVAGLVIQMPVILGSGLRTSEGVNLFFTNNQDGLMHLGFINALVEGFPPMRPEINAPLTDYHYFVDLLIAQLGRIGLPVVNVFFQFFPLVISVLTTGIIYQAMVEVVKSRKVAAWTSVVFLLAGDGAYWLTFWFPLNHGWEMLTLDNGADQFLNMPYAFSKMIFFAGWLLLNHYWLVKRRVILLALGLLTVVLTLFKVYWMMFLLGGWGMALLGRIVGAKGKKWRRRWQENWQEMMVLLVTGGVSLVLLGRVSTVGTAQIQWTPLVWPRVIISADHLAWNDWVLREQVYQSEESVMWLLVINGALVVVAGWFVFGARLFGLLGDKKSRQKLGGANLAFFLGIFLVGTMIGFNVTQGKGGLNSFNFLIVAAVALLVPLGVNLSGWWQKWGYWGKILVVVILILLVPRTMRNTWHYAVNTVEKGEKATRFYDAGRLALLAKLRELTDFESDLIAVNPDNQDLRNASVVAGLAGRKTYLSNQGILVTHNFDFSEQEKNMKQWFERINEGSFVDEMRTLGVTYVYLENYDLDKLAIKPEIMELAEASNEAGVILRMDKD